MFDLSAISPRITAMTLSGTNLMLEVVGLVSGDTNHVERCESSLLDVWTPQMTFNSTTATGAVSVGIDTEGDPEWFRVRSARMD